MSMSSASDGISSWHTSMPAFTSANSCKAREFAPNRLAMPNAIYERFSTIGDFRKDNAAALSVRPETLRVI